MRQRVDFESARAEWFEPDAGASERFERSLIRRLIGSCFVLVGIPVLIALAWLVTDASTRLLPNMA